MLAFCGLGVLKKSGIDVHLRVEQIVGQFDVTCLCGLHGLRVSSMVK